MRIPYAARPSALPSLPAWGAWIEIRRARNSISIWTSLPAWGAWIEMQAHVIGQLRAAVAPRMGSVD